MNEHDSEIMLGLMRTHGYQQTASSKDADLVVINTCSIRQKSYQKAVSAIGRLKERQGVKLAVTGCVVSHEGEHLLKRFPFIDFVLGPDHVQKLPQLMEDNGVGVQNFEPLQDSFHDLSDYEFPTVIDPIALGKNHRKVSAYVTIMKGCDNVCSFCIVPQVRGGEVYRPMGDIIREIQLLEKEGIQEVVLLGQNVNSYGKGGKVDFTQLLRLITQETGMARIRYTSPHPKDLSSDLIQEYGRNPRLCPHIHLPVQSGSNQILKKMRRSYSREVYLRKVERLRQVRPDIAITTDIIVGFPGETESDFQDTLNLVAEADFDASYSFSFSPRPGTEAASWADDIPRDLKRERLSRLQLHQEEISHKKNAQLIGKSYEVLIEEETDRPGQLTGKTPHGKIVNFDGDRTFIGARMPVRICHASAYSLRGELC